jgi:hypothetical protein
MSDDERSNYLENYQSATVQEAAEQEFAGVTNGFLGQVYGAITGRRVRVVGECATLLPCPCCGMLTLTERHGVEDGGYDICDHCNWEDDGTTDAVAYSTCNRGTMTDYRQRIADSPEVHHCQKWHSAMS